MWTPNVNSSEVFARAILQESLDLVPGCMASSLNAALLEFQWVLINLFSALKKKKKNWKKCKSHK